MIFTKIDGNIKEREDLGHVHVETAMVKSDDLAKSILRVKSDHHNEYGIRLEEGRLLLFYRRSPCIGTECNS